MQTYIYIQKKHIQKRNKYWGYKHRKIHICKDTHIGTHTYGEKHIWRNTYKKT